MTQPEPPPRSLPTAEQYEVQHAKRLLAVNARTLQQLADVFNRTADKLDRVPSPGRATYVSVAVQVIHEHAMWLANAHMEAIVEYAAAADRAREAGE